MAYSALVSLFPLLTVTATLLVQVRAEPASRLVMRALSHAVPPGTEGAVLESFRAHGERPASVLVVGAVVSLWAASRVITSLIEGFQAIYRIPQTRGFWRDQAVALGLVVVTVTPVAIAVLLLLFGTRAEEKIAGWMGLVPAGEKVKEWVRVVARLVRYGVSASAAVGVAALLYALGPNREQRWRFVWPGAVLTSVLWVASTGGLAGT